MIGNSFGATVFPQIAKMAGLPRDEYAIHTYSRYICLPTFAFEGTKISEFISNFFFLEKSCIKIAVFTTTKRAKTCKNTH